MGVPRLAPIVGLALLLSAMPLAAADLLIRGGTIHSGSARPFVGDVAVTGDRIEAVGRRLRVKAARTIDARGMIVAPGFIDPHAHLEAQLASPDPAVRLIPGFLLQGVTTAVVGNDGNGGPDVAPLLAGTTPVGINYGTHVGFGAVRRAVLGDADRPPTDEELARMQGLVSAAMCRGAIGFSTGIFYAPQSFARTGEVVALAREAARRGGIYDSHIRDESSYSVGLTAAVDEALAVGREAGLPVNISHIKALGVDVHGTAPAIIARIEAARAAGQRVTADQYPWEASGTAFSAALVPAWARDGGRGAMLARFADAALLPRLTAEMTENLRRRGGAGALLVTEGPEQGRTLAQIAAARTLDPVGAAIAMIREADPAIASFNQIEADIEAFMKRPWVMTGSDASTGHPRAFGSFARKYRRYVRERRTIDLRAFIHRSATLAADTLGLKDRGRLAPGAFADIVVFDPALYAERATYAEPALTAEGARTVIVNGVVAVDEGRLTGAAAGRPLAGNPPPGTCP